MIYISTVAFLGMSIAEILRVAETYNYAIEFSSGLPYQENIESEFLNAKVSRLPHNYFPAAKIPFVLNLASKNEQIRIDSIAMCINGLCLAKQAGSPFYAAHAGFCIDPNPNELGKKIEISEAINQSLHWSIFVNSVKEILKHANQNGVDFLVENNVIAQFNMIGDINPLLCCSSESLLKLVKEIDHPRLGVLLDTAHLKVSCETLGLNAKEELEKASPVIKAMHHSDNDGTKDSNEKLESNYWCGPFLKDFKHLLHVIEVKNLHTPPEINSQLMILKNFLNG